MDGVEVEGGVGGTRKGVRQAKLSDISITHQLAQKELAEASEHSRRVFNGVVKTGFIGLVFVLGCLFEARLSGEAKETASNLAAAIMLIGTVAGGGAFLNSQRLQKEAENWKRLYEQTELMNGSQQEQIEQLFAEHRLQTRESTQGIEGLEERHRKELEGVETRYKEKLGELETLRKGSLEVMDAQYQAAAREHQTVLALNFELQGKYRDCMESREKLEEERNALRGRVEHLEHEVERLQQMIVKLQDGAKVRKPSGSVKRVRKPIAERSGKPGT